MRRRSTRSSRKISPEEPAESPPVKLRRSRRKRSSSRSSGDETSGKSQAVKNVADNNDRKTPEKDKEDDKIQEIQSPVTRRHKNAKKSLSSNNHEEVDEDIQKSDIKSIKDEEEQEGSEKTEEKEGIEEKGPKGKSKSKNKSKSDNSPQVSESESHTQSEISENAQVTSQSPTHNSVNIPSDNALKSDDANIPSDKIVSEESDTQNRIDVKNIEPKTVTEADDTVKEGNDKNGECTEMDRNEAKENKHVSEDAAKEKELSVESKNESEIESEKSLQKDPEVVKEEESKVSEETVEKMDISETSDFHENDTLNESSINKDSTLNITESCMEDVQNIIESNKEIQDLKSEISDMFRTPEPKIRKRKWGNSVVSLDLIKNSVSKIDLNTIKTMCPNVEFLEEKDVKLEIRERKKSELKEKKIERKVSTDDEGGRGEKSKFQRQISAASSSEVEEKIESETDNAHIIAMNRKISIVDDTASKLKPPPSPAKNPVSSILYITNLVRPFTLKQLKDLLERTGKVKENGFWTDKVKSKCYVNYETEEEAEATRNALHGVNWPVGNAKQLCIEYATEEDMEKAKNPPVVVPSVEPMTAVVEKENEVPSKQVKEEERSEKPKEREKMKNNVREWDLEKQNKRRSFSRDREERDRRRHRRSPTPEYIKRKQLKEEEDIPQKRMDDLFRKTKASPSIYWLPLTPEEIAIKEQQRLQRMAEHKRRMEESSSRSGRADYGRGAPYRRRY